MDKNDWRNRGQEEYLKNIKLRKKKFKSNMPLFLSASDDPRNYNDHEHCDFCFKKIMENCDGVEYCTIEGYCTLDEKTWICDECFNEFKKEFNWVVLTT